MRESREQPAAVVEAAGRPALGYFCCYTPPELLWAAGLLPLRLRGLVPDSAAGDAYLSHLTCSFTRHVTAAVLEGAYHFLAGIVSVNTCDHVRRAHDAIAAKSGLPYLGFITAPRSFRASFLPWYREELERLQAGLQQHFRVKITAPALTEAIALFNQVRERLVRIDALRRDREPRLSGAETLTAQLAARSLPPDRFLALADQLLAAAADSPPLSGIRARVVLAGGELDDPAFVRALESQGAHVVGDLLCCGARGLGQRIEAGPDPLGDLAHAYLHQLPCARMMGEFPRRYQELRRLYHDRAAAGIIFQRIKFCQIWSTEVHNLRHRFETEPLPLLVLDREYGIVSSGQIKTRVQAFLERLKV
jgi:benzoyl-CoA reductase/2-hydroxyglutaryl-CoA dehydratase subunit BcrC/BadD/HgdB